MSEEKELALYELSMHLIPSLSADDAHAEHEKIVARIEKESGSVKMNQLPEDRALTYEMCKEITGKKHYYNNAYFSYVVAEMGKDLAVSLNSDCKNSKVVLRHLLIRLPKEALITRERRIPSSHKEDAKKTEDKKVEGPIDEESIDKTIDQLVVE